MSRERARNLFVLFFRRSANNSNRLSLLKSFACENLRDHPRAESVCLQEWRKLVESINLFLLSSLNLLNLLAGAERLGMEGGSDSEKRVPGAV